MPDGNLRLLYICFLRFTRASAFIDGFSVSLSIVIPSISASGAVLFFVQILHLGANRNSIISTSAK
jgi:hypothetical protein